MSQISWEDSSWKQLSLVSDEEVISPSHAKVYVFSDSVLCLGKVNQNPTSNTVWEEQLVWFKDSPQYKTLDTIDGEPMEFEWNIFPGFTTLQLISKVQEFMIKMGDPPQFQGRIIFMLMFNDISWRSEDNEGNAMLTPHLCLYLQKDSQQDVGHSSDLDQKKKWYSTYIDRPRGEWDMMMITFSESGHPVFRATSPLSRGTLKSKGGGKLSIHFCADEVTIETVFRTIISVNQLSI